MGHYAKFSKSDMKDKCFIISLTLESPNGEHRKSRVFAGSRGVRGRGQITYQLSVLTCEDSSEFKHARLFISAERADLKVLSYTTGNT